MLMLLLEHQGFIVNSKDNPTNKNNLTTEQIPVINIKTSPPKKHGSVAAHKLEDPIYVRQVHGCFQRLRQRMNFFFLGVFALLPWLQYDGHQAILFDISNQRFTLWSLTLWPQDLTLLAWLFILSAFLLFFVTAFLGRVWCGFMCPQTVWTFIFIWFEEKTEGSANQRKRLDEQALNFNKLWRKSLKHLCWLFFSLLTAITFVGYFVPMQQLLIDTFTLHNTTTEAVLLVFFALATYGNAGWMREIMCLHMCPYSRFQSAMFDQDTLTVSYDYNRGESRGPRGRKQDAKALGLGDCIDCNLCVQVCPTGIDIRDGLQYECINCGACVDACDGVMDKMAYPQGLIRYTTENELEGKKVHLLRPKLLAYATIFIVMSALLSYEIYSRVPLAVDIIRDRTELARENFNGEIENVFTLKILNMSQTENAYRISVKGIAHTRWIGKQEITVSAAEVYTLPISIAVDAFELETYMTDITFIVEQVNADGDNDVKIAQESHFFNKH
jgi:cytochrome c oxidase accessory protein FixG